jgi:hypothetical protein
MVAEMMSFGQLSRWYALLTDRALRKAIAKPFGLHETVLVPLLKHLSTIRNSCAHHALSRGNLDETVAAIMMRLCGRDGSQIVAARQAMQGQFVVDCRSTTDRVSG